LYALDTKINLEQGSTKENIEESMKNHILAKVSLEGKYTPQ